MTSENFFVILVLNCSTSPTLDEQQEIYLETCQASCSLVSNAGQAEDCRDKFCPNYADYLLTGYANPKTPATLASTNSKEVADFCAIWLVHLLQQFGWQYRVRLRLRECICAAGKDCLVK